MTPVAGALTITWLNQYVGPHRVCYRLVTAPPSTFTCVTVNCPNPPGSSNTITIPVLVDNESCDTLTWEVYVQAECEDINSTTGRVYVTPSPTFVPAPECTGLTLTCTEVPLVGFDITYDGRENANGGGYNGTETVDVGGDTSGSLIIGIGDPNDLLITNPGGGAATDGVYNNVPLTGGSGTGATATVTITAGVVSGVTSLGTALTPYAFGDNLGVDETFAPGLAGLAGEVINVVEVDLGTVIGINYTPPPGTLYLVPPTVTIDPATLGGAVATAVALLGNCPSGWDAGTNCLGDALGNYATEVAQGVSFDMCYDGGTYNGGDDLEADYGFVLSSSSDCCYDCVDVTIENNTGDTINFSYVLCADKTLDNDTLANGASITIDCVVNNSWSFDVNSVNVVVTTNSPPTCS